MGRSGRREDSMATVWANQGAGRRGATADAGRSPAPRVVPPRRHGRRVPGAARIRAKELPVFSRMVAAMLDSGIPLVQTLAALEDQTSSKTFRTVITGLRLNIEAGSDFSASLGEYPDVFDELYVSMMRAGEAGGLLSEIAARVARYLESAARMRRKIKSAMMYPAVVMFLAAIIATAMLMWLIPVFSDIYDEFEGNLPGPTRMLIALSEFLRS